VLHGEARIALDLLDSKGRLKFMSGQTVEMDRDGRSVVFEDDFIRWVMKRQVID
jgi:hypothetical protein